MLCESCVCLCVCMWNKETLKKEEINPVRLARKDHWRHSVQLLELITTNCYENKNEDCEANIAAKWGGY